MSYDLFLKPRAEHFDWARFTEALTVRPNYIVRDSKAFYENEDTGVYFCFEHREAGEEYPLLFNLNFFRPGIFALEAAPELTALVERFDLVVEDPQTKGMGTGEYDEEKMLAGWNYGNEFACQTIPEGDKLSDYNAMAVPRDEILRAWKWNLRRAAWQNHQPDSYVARVMFTFINGAPASFVGWPDAAPSIFPVVDYVVAIREELAPRKLFRRARDHALLTFAEARSLWGGHASEDQVKIVLNYKAPPDALVRKFKALEPFAGQISARGTDTILERELLPPGIV